MLGWMKYAEHNGDDLGDLKSAQLANLVHGATLYLRDPRKTPVTVTDLRPLTASFTVRVADFEDKGSEWVLPLWDISKFQTAPGSATLTASEQSSLSSHINALNRRIRIDIKEETFAHSRSEIASIQREIDNWLCLNFTDLPTETELLLNRSLPCGAWSAALEQVMDSKGLLQMDRDFVAQFASNPHAGEIVKGHRIALAGLGLCPYEGHIVRDPRTFEGDWTKAKRSRHILTRLAFMRVVLSRFRLSALPLYRTIYSECTLSSPRNNGFVSATFSRDVALSLFEAGQKTRAAAMYWQKVPAERLFISYLETPNLGARYQEAEAVLLFSPLDSIF